MYMEMLQAQNPPNYAIILFALLYQFRRSAIYLPLLWLNSGAMLLLQSYIPARYCVHIVEMR